MREIKIRYRIRSKNFPKVIDTDIVTLEQIEKGYISDVYKGCEILSRDLLTGFGDKNAKEIYEGDIVHGYWYDKSRIATIIFENGSFWIKGSDMIGNTEGFQFLLGSMYGGIEVIGNIYENPELLKEV